MNHRVTRKQENSRMCLVCGLKNPYGLKASFYEVESNELVCVFRPGDMHQSYPGRLHGGVITAVLDETIGRAVNAGATDMMWGVTVEFTTRFRKPVPLGVDLRVVGRITKQDARSFEGTGEIILPDGVVAASGFGKYYRLPIDKIADFKPDEQDWRVVSSPSDPPEIDF